MSVILPFHGTPTEADAALAALAILDLRPGDEVLVADNTDEGVLLDRPGADAVTAFACDVKRSAYAARNIAAERAANDWLLLLDADCRPRPDLLDRYFAPLPAGETGAVAGQVLGVPDQAGLVPRYIRARGHLDQIWLAEQHPFRPMAVTANLLLRREAWAAIGGFAEQTRSGADGELCWRLQDAGWGLELRLEALVHHEHRATLAQLLRQSVRDGAGARWASRRYPAHAARPRLTRELVRAAGGAAIWIARGEHDRAAFKLIDGAWVLAATAGSMSSNAAPVTQGAPAARTVALLDRFPRANDQALMDLARDAGPLRVEARARPEHPDWTTHRRIPAHLSEDDGPGVRLWALARLAAARPLPVLRELLGDRDRRTSALELAPAAMRLRRDGAVRDLLADAGRTHEAAQLERLCGATARIGSLQD